MPCGREVVDVDAVESRYPPPQPKLYVLPAGVTAHDQNPLLCDRTEANQQFLKRHVVGETLTDRERIGMKGQFEFDLAAHPLLQQADGWTGNAAKNPALEWFGQ